MTREEAIAIIRKEYLCVDRDCDIERSCGKCDLMMPSKEPILEAYRMAIDALEQKVLEYIKDDIADFMGSIPALGNCKEGWHNAGQRIGLEQACEIIDCYMGKAVSE